MSLHANPLAPRQIAVNAGPRTVPATAEIPPPVSFGFARTVSGGNRQVLDGIAYDPARQIATIGGQPATESAHPAATHYDTEHDGHSFPDKD
ncbi:hypothetical protein GCM10022225_09790 [Plantactinospora mayteni]|uniref:ATP-grasp-modified RiPP n=1 Tax=Plantactinospora mayteni TaxID=566021 RepID=A0ABQ4EHQ6_9ACTN|nr:hypothetical protein [Plantactinospora mayteni]GIG94272.1 hypothetical protein Pma05_08450 [Plantactinospora mayteni]